MEPPIVDWTLLYQLATKKMPHRHAHRPIWCSSSASASWAGVTVLFWNPFFHIMVSWLCHTTKHFPQPDFPWLWNNSFYDGILIPFLFLRTLIFIFLLSFLTTEPPHQPPLSFKISFFTFIIYLCIRVCKHVYLCVCVCLGQRTTFRSLFFHSVTWHPGIDLRSSSLVAITLSHWAILPTLSPLFNLIGANIFWLDCS